MNRRFAQVLLIALASATLLTEAALADSVRNRAGINYAGRILGLSPEGILIDAGGVKKTFPFSEISRLSLDDVPDLAKAEDLLSSGEPAEAAKLYAKIRDKGGTWLKHYVDARLVRCYDDSKQFYRATKALISLCGLQSPLVSQVKLPAVQGKGSADNQSVLKEIEQALATIPAGPFADTLKTLRINVMLVEGDPADVLGVVEQQLKSPDETARKQARAKHIELLLDLNQLAKAGKSLEQGRKELNKPEDQPYLYYLEGRYMFATAEARRKAAEGKDEQPVDERDYLRAALNFMRLPIHFSLMQKELAAESLVWAARCMQRANVPPQEVYVTLEEATRKFPNTQGAEMAQRMMQEMGGGS